MIICPNCQRENEDEYKYCLGCGTVLPRPSAAKPVPQPAQLGCVNCGAAIPPNFKFCGECGTPVPTNGGSPPAPAANPSASTPAPSPLATHPGGPNTSSTRVGDLVVIKPDGTEGARIDLHEGEVRLGRLSEHEVLASDPFLSPHHASLTSSNGSFILRDANSLNGVFIRITTDVEIQDGDFIRIGQELLRFTLVSPTGDRPADTTLTAGSPDQGYWGRLALICGPEMESRAFVFSNDEITLGREIGDILFRDDGFVSGRHACVTKVDGRIFLKDLGSSNGTYVRIRGERHVGNGDLILMGQQLFRVEV